MKLPWSVEGQFYITEGQKYFLTLFQISCATLETAYISNPPPPFKKVIQQMNGSACFQPTRHGALKYNDQPP